ncbi:MAG: transporter substrate-binding domain-containing protein [Methanocorpusculum sp.]|nr:transporter substrate-binding domain-containing protein [Methanocorpusculum sp.]
MRITKERLSKVTFSQPYSPGYNLCIVVREGSNVTEEQYTSGTAVTGIVGSTASADWLISSLGEAAYQNRLTDGSIRLYPTHADLVAGLNRGEVDCAVITEMVYQSVSQTYPLVPIARYETGNDYAVAMQNGDIVLQELINQGIADLKSSGKLDELMKKYHMA